MISQINKLMKKPLSNDEILDIVGGKANLITYPEMAKYKTLDQLLGASGNCIILYETKAGYGHWVGVMKTGANKVEFFDPYGLKPDDELKFIPEYFREESGQSYPHLCYLLYKSPYKIEYNHDQLQSKKEDISTCGRHVGCRINLKYVPLPEYVRKLTSNKKLSPDQLVTIMTYDV